MSFPFKPEEKRHRPDPWERWNARDAGPFEQDIFLFDTCVAGTSHVEGSKRWNHSCAKGSGWRSSGTQSHDPQAILVQTMSGQTVGCVPEGIMWCSPG
ncbi:MAG: hypothetical protein ACLVJ6_02685 [Merdibacter sp.]